MNTPPSPFPPSPSFSVAALPPPTSTPEIVIISGATGRFSAFINGSYRLTCETSCDYPVYRKVYGSMCIMHRRIHARQKRMWTVVSDWYADKYSGRHYAEAEGNCSLESCASRVWAVWDGSSDHYKDSSFHQQPSMNIARLQSTSSSGGDDARVSATQFLSSVMQRALVQHEAAAAAGVRSKPTASCLIHAPATELLIDATSQPLSVFRTFTLARGCPRPRRSPLHCVRALAHALLAAAPQYLFARSP